MEKIDTAAVFERMLDVYRDQASLFLPAALVVYVPVAILVALVRGSGSAGLALLAAVLSLIAGFAYQGVVVEAVRDIQDGVRDFTIAGVFRTVRPALPALIGASILAGIGIVIGFALLIVPGLVLLTWWALIAPVVIIERPGVLAALGRSRELVRGNGWRVFGIVVVLIIVQALVSNLLSSVIVAGLGDVAGNAIASLVTSTLIAPLSAIAATLIFLDLRRIHGGAPVPAYGETPPATPPTAL